MPQRASQDQYILSEEENQEIFDEDIKQSHSNVSINIKKPFAIFLGGQSGSGKFSLEKHLSDQLIRNGKPLIINSDKLREFHPDFPLLQKTEPRYASSLVNDDTRKWQQKLIEFTIKIRCNLILDGTPSGNPTPILATMQSLHEAGYYLQVSVLAVPARLSRLGICKRYEDHIAEKGIGRWVEIQTHDRQYGEIPNTLTLLEFEKIVDRIQIYARPTGLTAPVLWYDNQLKNGQWTRSPMVETILSESRNRVWTSDEQQAFTAAVQNVAEQMRRRGVNQVDIDNFYRYVECPL